jgi:hypothetical protein
MVVVVVAIDDDCDVFIVGYMFMLYVSLFFPSIFRVQKHPD